jgi:hypothetical protein
MHRWFWSFLIVLLAAGLCLAQDTPQQPQQPTPDQQKTDKSAKKDKKKKDKDKGQQDVLDTTVFSDRVANNVLNDLRDGLEGHSQRLMLSAFDSDKMDGYLSFEDQIQAFFDKYDAFRVHYRIAQSTVEGARGVVLVEFEMEQIPRAGGAPQRKGSQLRFELERGKKGWKIVDFRPRGFFS